MRIRRTTDKGLTYEASFTKEPSEKTLQALDAVAQAAVRHAQKEGVADQDYGYDERLAREAAIRDARAFIARRKAEELYSSAPPSPPTFTPSGLMHELRIGRNLAASILEELERAGELAQTYLGVYVPSAPAQPVGRGYALPLSQKEASALLRLFDWIGQAAAAGDLPPSFNMVLAPGGATLLREVRSRLKGGPL